MRLFLSTAFFVFTCSATAQQKKHSNENPIGVFDSGTGGLTVLQAMLTLDAFDNKTGRPGSDGLPDFSGETFQYLADQANMPYGNYASVNKTALLKEHILKNVNFFLQNKYVTHNQAQWQQHYKPKVKMVIIACNTATAYAIGDIKKYVAGRQKQMPVIGVIDAGAKAALEYQQHEKGAVGVFATAGTVASDGYPRTLKIMAAKKGMPVPVIVSQRGVGLAESIDRDFSFFSDTAKMLRAAYKGPSVKNSQYVIDTSLLGVYHFDASNYKLLCEFDDKGKCLDMQLNDPANYVRYHLVSLLEKMKKENFSLPLNTLILGCTHYPYMKDTIAAVLDELYNYKRNDEYEYRKYLSAHVELIDPAVETAKQAYTAMRSKKLFSLHKPVNENAFFIAVPNTSLKEIQLQPDGWFTYDYKYGRKEGERKEYVKYVPFDASNISAATYNRFKQALPDVYLLLKKVISGLN